MTMVPAIDIAIVGGGVAGTSLAIVLQRAGLSTAVIEREATFRDRVRGEACHPWGVQELHDLGLTPFINEIGGLELPNWTRYRDREVELEFAWSDAFPGAYPEIGFSHPALQEALWQGAADAGAQIYRPATATISHEYGAWTLQIHHAERDLGLKARFLVAADGKTSATRRVWNSRGITDPVHHWFGGMLAQGIDLPQDSSHQGYHDAGFSMLFPQGNDSWRVYYVGPDDPTQRFSGPERVQTFLAACEPCFPEGAFTSATVKGPLAFFPNAHVSASRIAGEMAVAIGDAAGAPDPSQGHGMSLLWRDVRVLRDLLLTEEWGSVPAIFAMKRREYETILRTHAAWVAPLTTETSPEAFALQSQVELAREDDPTALGYTAIFALGPDSQPTDDDARSRFFGEHKTENPVRIVTPLDKIVETVHDCHN
ncbi:MAG: FAD-dependent monooxygenase [Thermomicrobiales bacterium]|nr:FAD-dependent monooxygenase [Thermomicrobiales bacterium]